MSERFWSKLKGELFPALEVPEKLCPHEYEGEKPLECPECQEVKAPWIRRRLNEGEKKEWLVRIEEMRRILNPKVFSRIMYQWVRGETDYEISQEFQKLFENVKFFEKKGLPLDFLNERYFDDVLYSKNFDYLNVPFEEFAKRIEEGYMSSILWSFGVLEAAESELREDQPDLDKYLEWDAKVKEAENKENESSEGAGK